MNTFIQALKDEQKRNQRLIDLTAIPENSIGSDRLNLSRRGSSIYCYLHCYQGGKRIKKQYLGKLVSAPVRAHVAARVRSERLQRLQRNQIILQKLAKQYQDDTLESILSDMPNAYRIAALANAAENKNTPSGIVDVDGNAINTSIGERGSASSGIPSTGSSPAGGGLVTYRNTSAEERSITKRTKIYTAADDIFNERYRELRAWATADFEKNGAPFTERATFARDGTQVRSKGECIFYNLLQEFGILFRYDSVMEIRDPSGRIKKVSPDFLIQCFDGSLIIIEHLGWLSDKSYAIDFGDKLHWYFLKGYYPGKNLFITSDNLKGGTDSQQILAVVKQVEPRFFGY